MGNTQQQHDIKLEPILTGQNFSKFTEYLLALNQLISINLPFLRSNLNIESLSIDVVKPKESKFRDFFNPKRSVSLSTVVVQYTMQPLDPAPEETLLFEENKDEEL